LDALWPGYEGSAAAVVDAVVVGAGPNGLVAANVLADHGWSVTVVEGQPTAGGAVRTAELTLPGFHHDVFSAFYPMALVSPALLSLHLEDHGLRWCRTPVALANPTTSGLCASIGSTVEETAASLDRFSSGDGAGWRELFQLWERVDQALIGCLMRPFPPIRAATALAGRLHPSEYLDFARMALLPVRRLAEEHFTGEGGALILGGNALHADLGPESAIGGLYGWLLASLAQQVGFPVPEGGAARLIDAMVRRLSSLGGEVRCGSAVSAIEVRNGRAVSVRTTDGTVIAARRAILADTSAPSLYDELVGAEHFPGGSRRPLRGFQWDMATVKVDWALSGPVPWAAEDARRAATVHVADSLDELTEWSAQIAMGLVPGRPFVIFGQQSIADPTRAPAGSATGWAYSHVPRRVKGDAGGTLTGTWTPDEMETFARRIEDRIEQRAPGFRDLILARHIMGPREMESLDANLVGGAINGGTSQLHQQLVFRPSPGSGRPTTPIRRLYLASSAAHPGGGVHGAPGANAAHAALAADRLGRLHPRAWGKGP
jgi:phytoene dehydrogenase-like protein